MVEDRNQTRYWMENQSIPLKLQKINSIPERQMEAGSALLTQIIQIDVLRLCFHTAWTQNGPLVAADILIQ